MSFTRMTSGGANFSRDYFNGILSAIENDRLATGGRGVASGLELSAGTGLSLDFADGVILEGGTSSVIESDAYTMPASESNYVWINAAGEITLTATPADAGATLVCLGMVITDASAITEVSTSGRVDLPRFDALRDFSIGGDLAQFNLLDRQVAIEGGMSVAVRTVTTSGAILDRDYIVAANSGSGAIVLDLPAASDVSGRVVTVKRAAGANNVTVQADGSDTIDGSTSVVLSTLYDAVTLVSTGSAWIVI